MLLTYRYRVKSGIGELNRQARAVNVVWNFCNDSQKHALRWDKRWPTGYDLMRLTTGSSKELGISAATITQVCKRYSDCRQRRSRPYLRYRSKRSMGWIPLRAEAFQGERADGFIVHSKTVKVFKSRDLPSGAVIKDGGSFVQDARGNWFLNVCVELPDKTASAPRRGVGIDLGLKDFAALSTGEKIANPQHFRQMEAALAKAQQTNKRRLSLHIHTRISNARRDFLHKLSSRITQEFDYIAVGNVNAAGLAKTNMAKSVNDASWSSFRGMLRYKAITRGAVFEEVDEAWSTQTCNACGVIAGPKGRAGLNERIWTCGCGVTHDRDTNAAINILMRGSGHRAPVEGIATPKRRGNVKMEPSSLPPVV